MKKFFTLVIVSLLSAVAVQAQKVVINKTDGSKVAFRADEIQSVQFAPASVADQFVGSYKGTDKISVAIVFSYSTEEEVTYQITDNEDGTINLIVPAVTYKNTMMGNLYLGTYTIPNIPYDATKKAFVKAYKADNIKFHFKVIDGSGNVTKDQEYTFDKDVCKVTITKEADGKLKVSNSYQMGAMPMTIYGTFVGAKQ